MPDDPKDSSKNQPIPEQHKDTKGDNLGKFAKDILQDKLPDSKYLFRIHKLFKGASFREKSGLVIIGLIIIGIIGFSAYEGVLVCYRVYKGIRGEHPLTTSISTPPPHSFKTLAGDTITTFDISATNPYWQPTLTLSNGQMAIITIYSGPISNATWITDSTRGMTPLGAGGYPNTTASDNFILPGAPEGSLLMQLADGTHRFCTNSSQTQIVTVPGLISFVPNDDVANGATAFGDNR